MFLRYLLGEGKFKPSISPPYSHKETEYPLTLFVKDKGSEIIIHSLTNGNVYSSKVEDNKNETIFNELTKAIRSEFKPNMDLLKILSKNDYIVNAINDIGTIRKGGSSFVRFKLESLRFKQVISEKAR
jgi:hypothetical protein